MAGLPPVFCYTRGQLELFISADDWAKVLTTSPGTREYLPAAALTLVESGQVCGGRRVGWSKS